MSVESQQRCPNGHLLPRDLDGKQCTPVKCCGRKVRYRKPPETPTVPLETARVISEILPSQSPDEAIVTAREVAIAARVEEFSKVGAAVGRHATRMHFLKVPPGLQGAAAEQWADAKFSELLPLAAAETEFDLKYGDDKQRQEAKRDVLDATGRRRQPGQIGGGAVIVLAGDIKLPFMKPQPQVVDAVVIPPKEEE